MTRFTLALLTLALTPSAQGALWIVDDDGGADVDFTRIQDAVNASSSGDAVLVRSGNYGGEALVIDQKGLVITAEEGSVVNVSGSLSVANTTSSQRVVVRGLTREVVSSPFCSDCNSFSINVSSCAGVVWIEDCDVSCGDSNNLTLSCPTLRVSDSSQVVVLRTESIGYQAFLFLFLVDGEGLEAYDSSVYAFDCSFRGASGLDNDCQAGFISGFDGMPGVRVDGGTLYLMSSEARGGDGGQNQFGPSCGGCSHGDGGPGLLLSSAGTTFVNNPDYLGGGATAVGSCAAGTPGPATSVAADSLLANLAGLKRAVIAPRTVEGGGSFVVSTESQLGDTTLVYASTGSTFLPVLDPFDAVFLLHKPLFFLGSIVSPVTQQSFSAPTLPAALSFLQVHLQGVALTSASAVRLTAPSAMTILGG